MLDKSVKAHLFQDRTCHWWMYNCTVSEEDRSATFYLFNATGKMVGYQTYRPDMGKTAGSKEDNRYYTFTRAFAPWGMETVETGRPLALVEGIFDATPLNLLGFSTLALLTSNPPRWFKAALAVMRERHPCVVQLRDSDAAAKRLQAADTVLDMPGNNDPGSMGLERLGDFMREHVDMPETCLDLTAQANERTLREHRAKQRTNHA